MLKHRVSCEFDRFRFSLGPVGIGLSGYAALDAVSLLTCSRTGRPMNRASPHTKQPHSGHSPSGTSGQPAASACNCSNGRSSPHPVQYLVTCVILATSSVRSNTDVPRLNLGSLPIVT